MYEIKIDMDYVNHADRDGGINLYQRWDTQSIVDETDRWELTLWLAKKSPEDLATMDVTPRRLQRFRAVEHRDEVVPAQPLIAKAVAERGQVQDRLPEIRHEHHERRGNRRSARAVPTDPALSAAWIM